MSRIVLAGGRRPQTRSPTTLHGLYRHARTAYDPSLSLRSTPDYCTTEPEHPKPSTGAPSFLLGAAAFVIVVAGMRAAEAIIVPFLLSVFLAITSTPPLTWLERKGLPRILALLVVVASVVGILMVMGSIIGSSVDGFTRDLPLYHARLQQLNAAVQGWLDHLGIAVAQAQVAKYLDPNAIFKLVANALNGLGGVLGNAVLILLTVLFMLLETASFPLKLRAVLGPQDDSLEQFRKLTENVKRYLAIKTGTSLAAGVAVAAWLAILGVDFPVLWGLLAFLLNYVPNIGAIIAAAPRILLALIQLGVGGAAWTAITYLVIGNVIGNVVEPRLMGHSLGLSTLVVFISLVFWGWVLVRSVLGSRRARGPYRITRAGSRLPRTDRTSGSDDSSRCHKLACSNTEVALSFT